MREPAEPAFSPSEPSQGAGTGKRFGLPRKRRLLKHALFDRVYRQGQRQFSGTMTLFYLRREESEAGPRVGLTVPRALGGAVVRNRIKRRMRDAVRHALPQLDLPVDVVINPKKAAATLEMPQLRSEVERAFGKIRTQLQRAEAQC